MPAFTGHLQSCGMPPFRTFNFTVCSESKLSNTIKLHSQYFQISMTGDNSDFLHMCITPVMPTGEHHGLMSCRQTVVNCSNAFYRWSTSYCCQWQRCAHSQITVFLQVVNCLNCTLYVSELFLKDEGNNNGNLRWQILFSPITVAGFSLCLHFYGNKLDLKHL